MGAVIVSLVLIVLVFGALYLVALKTLVGATEKSRNQLVAQIESAEAEIKSLPLNPDKYASKKLIASLEKQAAEIQAALEKDQARLKEAEEKLDKAQRAVEEKETKHQEQKSAKDDEAERLEKLKVEHERLSAEAMDLEQKVSKSLETLERLLSEISLTDDQRAALDSFSKLLEQSGARLRDLISEYDMITQRLTSLQEQHAELEEEYTRLVEKQLGA